MSFYTHTQIYLWRQFWFSSAPVNTQRTCTLYNVKLINNSYLIHDTKSISREKLIINCARMSLGQAIHHNRHILPRRSENQLHFPFSSLASALSPGARHCVLVWKHKHRAIFILSITLFRINYIAVAQCSLYTLLLCTNVPFATLALGRHINLYILKVFRCYVYVFMYFSWAGNFSFRCDRRRN